MTGAPIDLAGLEPAFGDPVHDAQRTFRVVLEALSRPGRIGRVDRPETLPRGVDRAAAAALLALADADTPVWLGGAAEHAADYFRFHCGCPLAERPGQAVFALVDGVSLRLSDFSIGSHERPDLSATVIAAAERLEQGRGWRLRGPGVDGVARLRVDGLPAGFLDDWRGNAEAFPRGADLLLTAGDELVGLPRGVRIEG